MKASIRAITAVLLLVLPPLLYRLTRAASASNLLPPSPAIHAGWHPPAPAQPFTPPQIPMLGRSLAVAALTQGARTSLVAVLPNETFPIQAPQVMDGPSTLLRASTLAYLVLPGLDPTENYIEARDLTEARAWRIQADEGGVLFGVALDPEGAQLAYLEVDSRLAGAKLPWRVVTVDLSTGARETILDGSGDGKVALLPVDWAPGTLLYRGLTPFTAEYLGLWASRADGSDLRRLANEAEYLGRPRLSPEGDLVAFLAFDPGVPPSLFGRGEPAATSIRVLDVRTGEISVVLGTDSQHEFTDLQWASEGLLAVQGDWDASQNAFVDRRIIQLKPEAGSLPEVAYSATGGEVVRLASCRDGGWLAAVQYGDHLRLVQSHRSVALAKVEGANLEWMACRRDLPATEAKAGVSSATDLGARRP